MSRGSLGNGFSLVELSIVLVILGLLTGGILAGQSLIRAAELRSITTEYQRYRTAIALFRDRYMALPGDMANATRFWGKDTTYCPGDAAATGAPGTCNGNGNGRIEVAAAPSTTGEMFQVWKQLALAGLIEGTYSGVAGPTDGCHAVPGDNVPASKIATTGWSIRSWGVTAGGSKWFAMDYGYGTMSYGAIYAHSSGIYRDMFTGAIKAEEAWGVDVKLDDGLPASGKAIATGLFSPLTGKDPCFLPNSGTADVTNLDMSYNTGSAIAYCGFVFRQVY